MTASQLTIVIASFPFWPMLGLLVLASTAVLVGLALLDIFQQTELTRRQQVAWMVIVVLVPILGAAVYLLFRPEQRTRLHDLEGRHEQDETPPYEVTRAGQLHMLASLHDSGKLSDSEFAAAKVRLLRDHPSTTPRR